MFHRFTAGDLDLFLGGSVCLLFGCCGVLFALFCFPRFRDQSSSYAKLNDRLSCHGAHCMGEKNASMSARRRWHLKGMNVNSASMHPLPDNERIALKLPCRY